MLTRPRFPIQELVSYGEICGLGAVDIILVRRFTPFCICRGRPQCRPAGCSERHGGCSLPQKHV